MLGILRHVAGQRVGDLSAATQEKPELPSPRSPTGLVQGYDRVLGFGVEDLWSSEQV